MLRKPFQWFSNEQRMNKVWIGALICGSGLELALFYLAVSCASPAAGLAGILCYFYLLPALIILLIGALLLNRGSITVTTINPVFMIASGVLVFVINAFIIALVLFGIVRLGRSVKGRLKAMRDSHV